MTAAGEPASEHLHLVPPIWPSQDAVITADALHAQREHAGLILEGLTDLPA